MTLYKQFWTNTYFYKITVRLSYSIGILWGSSKGAKSIANRRTSGYHVGQHSPTFPFHTEAVSSEACFTLDASCVTQYMMIQCEPRALFSTTRNLRHVRSHRFLLLGLFFFFFRFLFGLP